MELGDSSPSETVLRSSERYLRSPIEREARTVAACAVKQPFFSLEACFDSRNVAFPNASATVAHRNSVSGGVLTDSLGDSWQLSPC